MYLFEVKKKINEQKKTIEKESGENWKSTDIGKPCV